MIKKINYLKNCGIFKDFNWDLINDKGEEETFKKLNIIYGGNYSGKTTLSRVINSFVKNKEDVCNNAEIEIELENGKLIKGIEDNIHRNIHVFNEDYIRKNLGFFINNTDGIEPFSVVGERNTEIEKKIQENKKKLYDKYGLINEKEKIRIDLEKNKEKKEIETNTLEEDLSEKASTGEMSIKQNHETFGDINYNKGTLKKEIKIIKENNLRLLNESQIKGFKDKIDIEKKEKIIKIKPRNLRLNELYERVRKVCKKTVKNNKVIEEIAVDILLSNWIKKGMEIHKGKELECKFCRGKLSDDRINRLEEHFNKEYQELELEVNKTIKIINDEIKNVESWMGLDKSSFYSYLKEEVKKLNIELSKIKEKYKENLNELLNCLEDKKGSLVKEIIIKKSNQNLKDEDMELYKVYSDIVDESNRYSENIENEKLKAQKFLRYDEILKYIEESNYNKRIKEMGILEGKYVIINKKHRDIKLEIDNLEKEVIDLQESMSDEGRAVELINDYLSSFFYDDYIKLKITENKTFRIMRDKKIAMNLSEGERSLIAFCYFIVSLDDSNVEDNKQIIWIDDPISSLDSNHIYFIYSIINSRLCLEDNYHQLFITTHNLEFLKYLYNLPGANKKNKSSKFIVNRHKNMSKLEVMPKYMKGYVTEYIFLFEQIYKCSNIKKIDDTNYKFIYNFGNNARKFLELHLAYKYPCETSLVRSVSKYFNREEDEIPKILTFRYINEESHLKGRFEKGSNIPIQAEVVEVAKFILDGMRQDDQVQFDSLLKSIGILVN